MENKKQNKIIITAIVVFVLACICVAPDFYAFSGAAMNELFFPAFDHGVDTLVSSLSCLRGIVVSLICIGIPLALGIFIYLKLKNMPQPPAPPSKTE